MKSSLTLPLSLGKGEATRQWGNITPSIDQLGHFLDEYVLQPIGIKQRPMQL
jgi:hypothetical protein